MTTRRPPSRITAALVLALAAGVSGSAIAQSDAPTTTPTPGQIAAKAAPASDEWQAVDGSMGVRDGESFRASDLVAGAYGFIWAAVAGFVFTVWRRAGHVERDLDALRKEIDARAQRR